MYLVLDVQETDRECHASLMIHFPLHAERGTLDFQEQKPVSLTQTVRVKFLLKKKAMSQLTLGRRCLKASFDIYSPVNFPVNLD